jgi:NAD-dependent dihydropyrimidine dehydrogenase PreA subunit
MKKYVIDRGCKACDACYWACPKKAIYVDQQGAHIEQEKCVHCGICYESCANEAISVYEE